MANFCCSIESEPRTLKQGQLNHAREIAVDIVQKKEPDEATFIFNELQGLTQVVEIKNPPLAVADSIETTPEKAEEKGGRAVMKEEINVETCCQCFMVESSPECMEIKEPLSAPF